MSNFKVKRPRRQPPFKGGRTPAFTGLIPGLEAAIQKEMDRFGVTRSFVIATACAFALGIEDQPNYRPESPRVPRHLTLVDLNKRKRA